MNSDAYDSVLANLEETWQLPARVPPHEAARHGFASRWLYGVVALVTRNRPAR